MKDIKGSFKSRHSKYSSIASRHKSCFSMQIPVDVRSLMKSSWTNLRIFSLVNLPLLLWVNIPLRSISRMRKSMQRLVSTPMMQRRLKLETYLLAWSECQSISTVRFHNVSNKALTPWDFRNPRVCSVDFGKILIFFDDCLCLTQRPLEPKGRRPKPHWSGAGAVSSFWPIFK